MSDSPRLLVPALGRVYRALAPFTEPIIRVIAGVSLVMHGYPKLFGGMERNVAFFEQAGFRPALFWTIVVGLTETVGGFCLAIGFMTRVVARPILIFLLTAITYHWRFGFNWVGRGIEYPLFFAALALHFLMRGGGPCSLDGKIGREI